MLLDQAQRDVAQIKTAEASVLLLLANIQEKLEAGIKDAKADSWDKLHFLSESLELQAEDLATAVISGTKHEAEEREQAAEAKKVEKANKKHVKQLKA